MKSNQQGRRAFFRRMSAGVIAASIVPESLRASLTESPFDVTISNCVSRTEQEMFRDVPSVLDYDGVYNNPTKDSYVGLQKAFDNERELVMPRNFRCKVSQPLIIKQRGFSLRGGSKVATQIHPTHNGNVIEVGDITSATGFAPRCTLENFSILGSGIQTGGIVLWDKSTNGWADASKGCRLSNLLINDIGAGPMLRIRSWANYIEHVETVQGCLYGVILEEQALTNTLIHPYITGCMKEGIIIGDLPERKETCNVSFIGAIVQQCGGEASSGVIVINGAASTSFYDLYLERNGEKGASYDINITDKAVLTEIRNVTSRGAVKSALIRDAGVNTVISNVWRYGNADSIIRRVGTVVTGEYSGFYLASGNLPNKNIRDLASGDAVGRYSYNDNGLQYNNFITKKRELTSNYSIPANGNESGWIYSIQTTSAIVISLPANAKEGHYFEIASSGSSLTLKAALGATLNGVSERSLTTNCLFKVVCVKNSSGTSAQWMMSV